MRNAVNFQELIDLSTLIPHLASKFLLSDEDLEYMTNKHFTRSDKITKLLQIIPTKGKSGFQLFMHAIKEEKTHLGHKELYQIVSQCESLDTPQSEFGKHETVCNVL